MNKTQQKLYDILRFTLISSFDVIPAYKINWFIITKGTITSSMIAFLDKQFNVKFYFVDNSAFIEMKI